MKRHDLSRALAISLALMTGQGASAALPSEVQSPCMTIRGRAHLFIADGKLRLWQVGTKHEYEPDEGSWQRVQGWLEAGATGPAKPDAAPPVAAVWLYGDFVVCPTEAYRPGSVQKANVKSVARRRYVLAP